MKTSTKNQHLLVSNFIEREYNYSIILIDFQKSLKFK